MELLSFHELVSRLNASRDPAADGDITLDALRDEQTLKAVEDNLLAQGITDYHPQRLGGTTALVLELPGDRVLRLVKANVEKPIDENDWTQIQPIQKLGTVSGIEGEVFPKVLTLDVAIKQGLVSKPNGAVMIKQMVAGSARKGQLLWDIKPDNFAILPDADGHWVPFVLDKGARAPMSEMNEGKIGNDPHTNLDKFRTDLSAVLAELGAPDARIEADPVAYLDALQQEQPPLAADFRAVQEHYVGAHAAMEEDVQAASQAPSPSEVAGVSPWRIIREKYMPAIGIGVAAVAAAAFFGSGLLAIGLGVAGMVGLLTALGNDVIRENDMAAQAASYKDNAANESYQRQLARAQSIEKYTEGQGWNKSPNYFTSKVRPRPGAPPQPEPEPLVYEQQQG